MTSVTPFVTTVDGATTSYLPLTTAWPSAGPECASGLYHQIGGNFMGWDPWYMQDVDTKLSTCWPPEASTWWTQDALPTTVLGPVFTCPEAYYEAYTSTLDSRTTQTICCPSHYRLNVPDFARATFPSQCTSTVTAQQSLTWEDQFRISETDGSTWSWTLTSTIVPDDTVLTVFGWPVNGLNVVASSTATPTSSTVIGTTASTSTPSSTTESTTKPTSDTSNNLGLIVGVTVGVVIALLLVAFGAFLVWRKRRAGRGRFGESEHPQKAAAYSAISTETRAPSSSTSELPVVNHPAELNTTRDVYELPH